MVLSTILIEVLTRQQRQIETSQAALNARAENLAEELRLLGDYLNGALLALDDSGRVVSVNRAAEALLGAPRETLLGRVWQETLGWIAMALAPLLDTQSGGLAQRGVKLAIERATAPDRGRGRAVGGSFGARTTDLAACSTLRARKRRRRSAAAPGRGGGVRFAPDQELAARAARIHLARFSTRSGAEAGARPPRTSSRRCRVSASSPTTCSRCRAPGARPARASRSAMRSRRDPAGPLTRVRVELDTRRELRVEAHRGQLVHALFNLIDNACRVTPAGDAVLVRTAEEDDGVVVEILDGGARNA
jgi:signal transduction histidine kinase